MKSNIYIMLEKFFNRNIIDIAKELNYDEDNILILESNENELKLKYKETYDNLKSCVHNRDDRTLIAYAQDLVCSWIFEDYLLVKLKECGLNIELSGTDKKRKLLNSKKIGSTSDYIVTYDNKKAFIELANDYKGYWNKNKVCDLRDDKFLHIKNMSSNAEYSFLLGIDFLNSKFFIMDLLKSNENISYKEYHWAYHKPVYSIDLSNIKYYDFSFSNIASKITSFIE